MVTPRRIAAATIGRVHQVVQASRLQFSVAEAGCAVLRAS